MSRSQVQDRRGAWSSWDAVRRPARTEDGAVRSRSGPRSGSSRLPHTCALPTAAAAAASGWMAPPGKLGLHRASLAEWWWELEGALGQAGSAVDRSQPPQLPLHGHSLLLRGEKSYKLKQERERGSQ